MTRRVNTKGYVEVYNPMHPLARNDGWVLEHRQALFNLIGPGPQPCYWCGWVLPWQHDAGYKHHICVDHLNERRDDNDARNLVPSCWYCNANRSWSRKAPLAWAAFVAEMHGTDPNTRTPAIFWLADRVEHRSTIQHPPVDPATGRAILGSRAKRPVS